MREFEIYGNDLMIFVSIAFSHFHFFQKFIIVYLIKLRGGGKSVGGGVIRIGSSCVCLRKISPKLTSYSQLLRKKLYVTFKICDTIILQTFNDLFYFSTVGMFAKIWTKETESSKRVNLGRTRICSIEIFFVFANIFIFLSWLISKYL